MDETYIKMSDCPEIQGQRGRHANIGSVWWFKGSMSLEEGICTYHRGKGQVVSGMFDEEDWMSLSIAPDLFIWLPLQHQLQAMYLKDMPDGTYQKVATLAEVFHDYHEKNGYPVYAYTMDQLWLAFYMFEKHQKTWDGNEWKAITA